MSRKIIIAIDSFKGCLSSQEAGEAAARGVRQACPDCQVKVLPVADGGEGLLEALVNVTGGSLVKCRAHGPLMEPRDTCYGLSGDGRTAFIEMARISGLPLVPEGLRNPLLTTTYGTGELIADALLRGCRRFLVGLGGSATNDAGLGMLQALGFRFLDKNGADVGQGQPLLHRQPPHREGVGLRTRYIQDSGRRVLRPEFVFETSCMQKNRAGISRLPPVPELASLKLLTQT